MDSDQAKLFVGGISWETTDEVLRDYFSRYGDVLSAAVIRDKVTDRPRGFGFVVFSDPAALDSVVRDQHTIAGRLVEVKKALSREEQQMNARVAHTNFGRTHSGVAASIRTKKIFVGGLPSNISEDEFGHYFETYGHVTDVVLMYDKDTQRSRGFGFISFDTEDAVDRVLHKTFHDLNGKKVEVKRALPKDAHPYGGSRTTNGGGGYRTGSGYSGAGRVDSNRNSHQNTNSGGFPYGNSGYGGPGYKYGSANRGIWNGSNDGYGVGNAGLGSHGGAAGYGSPNVSNSAYAGGPQANNRSSWIPQPPSGYGSVGYGNAPWGPSDSGPGSAPCGQLSTGNVPDATQAYRSGGYAGSDGSYNAGYDGAGGQYRSAPNVGTDNGACNGNGYGNANGDSGHGNAAWGSAPSQASGSYGPTSGPYSGYGGSYDYGGAQTRQSQYQ